MILGTLLLVVGWLAFSTFDTAISLTYAEAANKTLSRRCELLERLSADPVRAGESPPSGVNEASGDDP